MRKNKGGVWDRAESFPQNCTEVWGPGGRLPLVLVVDPARRSGCKRDEPATFSARAGCTAAVGSSVQRSITRAYYRNSVGGLLLFDITNRRSFQNVHEWLEETKVHVQPYQIVFVLVGHKCDLDTQRQVSRHEAEKLAAAYGMKYIETSARDAINVEKAFTDLTRDIYELVKRGEISIQEGWEGVKSGFVPNVVHSSEEVVKSDRRCLC
ncbi:PREDICTED: ras-related protein Rab-39B-like [Nipponia nippon]|nr:PREDICTED: ras-related protein Rab-39B-like [Nipponia nippon]